MTSRGRPWDEPEDGYTEISPLPLDPSMLDEELDDLAERSSRGELRPEKRAELAKVLEPYYRPDAPLREFIGFAFVPEHVEELGWADTPLIYVRVMARSGFEASKAVNAELGDEYAVSIRNREEGRMTR